MKYEELDYRGWTCTVNLTTGRCFIIEPGYPSKRYPSVEAFKAMVDEKYNPDAKPVVRAVSPHAVTFMGRARTY